MDEKYFNNEYGKNIADKYLEFFLGGEFGTNPVALEIPIRPSLLSLKNLDDNKRAEILTILREHGLDAGDNPGQIMVSNDSIITPIIAPENIIPLYKTIEFLLRHYYSGPWFVFYPHIIDAKNIVPSQISGLSNTDWAERINYVDDMLHKISAQRDIFLSSDDEKRSQFAREVKSLINSGYFPPDVLFAGSTISDPYSVATGQSNRCLRYATSEPGYAIRYVWNDGKPNNFDLISKSGIKYGFVFLYKSRKDFCQYWFNNGGIEEKKEGYLGAVPNPNGVDETMVNRFNNECIGEYLFFGVPFIH
ncbi:MAG: hypothetical protein MJ158_02855, partial [Alphaproteobacteria bacterium]|nr:hypothetical protein [Alphaproteobacteria bacterium]